MIYNSREELVEAIITRFSNRYKIEYNASKNIISITKNQYYPICVDIGIKYEYIEHHIPPHEYYPFLDKSYYVGDEEYYNLDFLDKVQYILNNLEENINIFINFAQNITNFYDIEGTTFSYLVIMDNIYIKNFRTGRIINICPIKPLSEFNNDSFLELSVRYINPVIDKNLMTIYAPAANISDTWDTLRLFLV